MNIQENILYFENSFKSQHIYYIMQELISSYNKRKQIIKERLKHFKEVGKQSEKVLFSELAFCLCTPQSKAKKCDEAISILKENKLLFKGDNKEIANILKSRVRFHNNKAKYIVEARNKLYGKIKKVLEKENKEAREFLIKEVNGMSLKEAGHFLRNTGNYEEITILDRHILKNLKKHKVIKELPKTLTKNKYLGIEKEMLKFCKKINIPPEELDILFWSEETGEVFK